MSVLFRVWLIVICCTSVMVSCPIPLVIASMIFGWTSPSSASSWNFVIVGITFVSLGSKMSTSSTSATANWYRKGYDMCIALADIAGLDTFWNEVISLEDLNAGVADVVAMRTTLPKEAGPLLKALNMMPVSIQPETKWQEYKFEELN